MLGSINAHHRIKDYRNGAFARKDFFFAMSHGYIWSIQHDQRAFLSLFFRDLTVSREVMIANSYDYR